VRLHTPWPPGKIGGAGQGFRNNLTLESLSGPNAGLTEVLIPAGFVTTVYDPVYQLSANGKSYLHVPSNKATTIPEPGLPFSLCFAPSRARKTCCFTSPHPMKPLRAGAFRHLHSGRSRWSSARVRTSLAA